MKSLLLVITLCSFQAFASWEGEGGLTPVTPYQPEGSGGLICSFSNNKLWLYVNPSSANGHKLSASAQIYHQSSNRFTHESLSLTYLSPGRYAINRSLAGYSLGTISFGHKAIVYSSNGQRLSVCRLAPPDVGGGDGGEFYP